MVWRRRGAGTIIFSRRDSDNAAVGRAVARASAPGDREADVERFSALVKALAGEEPWVYRMKDGRLMIACGGAHLDGFSDSPSSQTP